MSVVPHQQKGEEVMSVVPHQQKDGLEVAVLKMQDKFAAALPAHIPSERFVRVALSALADSTVRTVAQSPNGRRSILEATLKAASDGLLLDRREAALVAFGDVVQYMPMVAGIMKKARNSGEISSLICQVVYSNDDFEINYVTSNEPVTHRPNLRERGEPYGVYAIARLKDGNWSQPEFMTRDEVERIRQRSRAKNNGPWVTDFWEMARKTVIRRLAKYLPSSTDKDGFQEVVRRDDELIDLTPSSEPEPIASLKRSAAKLLALSDPPHEHDHETGEVIEDAAATEAADV